MSTHAMAYTKGLTLVDYGKEVEHEIVKLQTIIEGNPTLAARYNPRWLAIKLLEEDADLMAKVEAAPGTTPLLTQARESIAHLRAIYGDDVDTVIADWRYGWINGLGAC